MLFQMRLGLILALAVHPALAVPGRASESEISGRSGFAEAEASPYGIATCESLPETLAGFSQPERRVDLWIKGALTLVHTDGALWYLAICAKPSIRVLCVTYSDNGMKLGEQVTFRGAFSRQDSSHVLLDPCLASRDGAD